MLVKMQGAAFHKLDPANFDTSGDCQYDKNVWMDPFLSGNRI
jgi:hypothetical protein